jgi:hypothetical protein
MSFLRFLDFFRNLDYTDYETITQIPFEDLIGTESPAMFPHVS